ncbi:MAG: glycosyl hydrolase, partial [Chloroflexi bacterium]|nr:glycosyl hydrolase [Chloroflexota bacterium]
MIRPITDPSASPLAVPRHRRQSPDSLLDGFRARQIGPFRGGRVVAVAGSPMGDEVFYFGSTGGGVWKTTDAGLYWQNISDGFFKRASVGAIAVAPSDPNLLYVGMGEACLRGNTSHGDGVYRSTDGGRTWRHLGLAETHHIARIRVDPRDPDLVYVAALGHAHGPNAERGLYRSRNGGSSWQRVLFRDEHTGAVDLSLDPTNPRILYCSLYQVRRTPWNMTSGGPGSGLFRSEDGGTTWTEITRTQGLPRGVLGRIGVAAAPRAGRVYAIVEAEDGAVFRSEDAGRTWTRQSEQRALRTRPWYYHHIFADPRDAETIWVLSDSCWRSIDGGATFASVALPHGDHHDLWIDPQNVRRMIAGNDGGATVTANGGESWTPQETQPTAEIYHVTTDMSVPYRVLGAQQDNSTISIPSRSALAGIHQSETYAVGGGESGFVAARPDDPAMVYAGTNRGQVTQYDHRSGQARSVDVWPEESIGVAAESVRHRFRWSFPIVLSPHDPDLLYVCANVVFCSRDRGSSWKPISPDLTRDDQTKLGPSGGAITKDNVSTEFYCAISAFAESPRTPGLLWVGSDDGRVHRSADAGRSWQDVTPRSMGPWTLISVIEPSRHDPATAYIAATRYQLDDLRPYLFKTTDHGRTWTAVTRGIAKDDSTRVVREDPVARGLLYAGTETGLYVSFDGGTQWHRLRTNLPVVPIHDLTVKDDDLVLATHGRGFWILDAIGALRQDFLRATRGGQHLFLPGTTVRFRSDGKSTAGPSPVRSYRLSRGKALAWASGPGSTEVLLDAGTNPDDGVVVRYYLPEQHRGRISLTFLDAQGCIVRKFDDLTGVPGQRGVNSFVWNMRFPGAAAFSGEQGGAPVGPGQPTVGPLVAPGSFVVRLNIGGTAVSRRFEIRGDPRSTATAADFEEQLQLLLRLRDALSEAHGAIDAIRSLLGRLDTLAAEGSSASRRRRVAALHLRLKEIEGELIQVEARG